MPREALPVFLAPEEEREPLKVLADFTVSTHPVNYVRLLLQEWFQTLFAGTGNISNKKLRELRYFAMEYTRLMEACSVIVCRKELGSVTVGLGELLSGTAFQVVFPNKSDYWKYLPHRLSEEQVERPFSVLEAFFHFKSLTAWRLLFRDLEDGLISTDNDFFETFKQKEQLFHIYHHLSCLPEAALLMTVATHKADA